MNENGTVRNLMKLGDSSGICKKGGMGLEGNNGNISGEGRGCDRRAEENLRRSVYKHRKANKLRNILRSRKCQRGCDSYLHAPNLNRTLPSNLHWGLSMDRDASSTKNRQHRGRNFQPVWTSLTNKKGHRGGTSLSRRRNKVSSMNNRSMSSKYRRNRIANLNQNEDKGKRSKSFHIKTKARMGRLPSEFQDKEERNDFVNKNFYSLPKSRIIDFIIKNRGRVKSNKKLFKGLKKLRNNNLLKEKRQFTRKIEEPGSKGYVYNDYHSRNCSYGYGRSQGGTFFCR